jgi:hypothetical protein
LDLVFIENSFVVVIYFVLTRIKPCFGKIGEGGQANFCRIEIFFRDWASGFRLPGILSGEPGAKDGRSRRARAVSESVTANGKSLPGAH